MNSFPERFAIQIGRREERRPFFTRRPVQKSVSKSRKSYPSAKALRILSYATALKRGMIKLAKRKGPVLGRGSWICLLFLHLHGTDGLTVPEITEAHAKSDKTVLVKAEGRRNVLCIQAAAICSLLETSFLRMIH